MRTTHQHPYHGITLTNGHWRIQILLLDKYRVVKSFAVDAETAARRHDITMKRLEKFCPASLEPNFPADYDALNLTPWMTDGESLEGLENDFRAMLLHWEGVLAKEFVENGWGSVNQLASFRQSERQLFKAQNRQTVEGLKEHLLQHALGTLRHINKTLRGQLIWADRVTMKVPHNDEQTDSASKFFRALEMATSALDDYQRGLEATPKS